MLACRVTLYALPTVPLGNGDVVVIESAGLTVMLSCLLAVCAGWLESLTCTVKFVVPVAVGVPVIAPVLAFSCNPAGREVPLMSDQL